MTELITSSIKAATIQIKIEAFGAIERQLPADLHFICQSDVQITQVLEQILQYYPESIDLLERCACAIGEDIVPRQMQLTRDTHLVLLSPVAGG